MSRKEIVLLVSRALALLLMISVFAEVTYLPERILSLSHHAVGGSVLPHDHYWRTYYLMAALLNILRAVVMFVAGVVFWRCGPAVEAMFSPRRNDEVTAIEGGGPLSS